jgi:hypothetical protein
MKRLRFRLSTLLLLTACIAAGLATRNRRSPWYVSKSVPSGFQSDCKLAAFEDQDLLVCLKTSRPERFVVRRLSTGEVLHDFDGDPLHVSYLQAGQDGQLYGFGWHRVTRIDPTTAKSIELMTTSDDAPESELVKAVSPDGRSVLIAAKEVVELPSGRSIIRPSTPVTYRVRDLASGQLRWELPTTETRDSMGSFSSDGERIGIQIGSSFQVWDYKRNVQIYDTPVYLSTMVPPILFPDGRRVFGGAAIWDLRNGVELGRVDFGSHYATIVNDSFIIAEYDGQLRYWRRRRVEGSWSPLDFPEAWIACVLAIACVCDPVRHSRRQRNSN